MTVDGAFLTLIGRSVNVQNCPKADLRDSAENRLPWVADGVVPHPPGDAPRSVANVVL